MRSRSVRTRMAVVLLGLMALMVLPRTWFHTCAHTAAIEHAAGHATIAADGHCPICEQVQPHFVQPTAATSEPLAVHLRTFAALLPVDAPGTWVEAGSTRGPPLS